MERSISKQARTELVGAVGQRYQRASKREKTKILDEFVALTKCHRKHAIRLLTRGTAVLPNPGPMPRRVYDEAVREALIVIWEAADRICSKRLQAILPTLVEAMERHGHLNLEPSVRARLLSVSASTIDRLLSPMRNQARGGRKRRASAKKASKQIPLRTFADWKEVSLGFLEIDFVEHCGGSMAGSFLHSLAATDVYSGWFESVPLLAREQSLVVEGLGVIGRQLPIPVLGIDSDNDSAFINDTLLSYCERRQIEFTRSRAYRKNDQAWIEQKNGAVIRRFVGHERFVGVVAGQTLAQLYQALRVYVNYFQPSLKLREKRRHGSKVRKSYFPPATPCDRLLEHSGVAEETKEMLRSQRAQLDPAALLHRIRDMQAALAALVSPDSASGPGRETLDEFLAQLPRLWQSGDARPTHRQVAAKPRHYRTRKDPFEAVWTSILLWLQEDPEATAKSLFDRLRQEYPGRFPDGQLRTLQRRIREWRQVMARKLVFSCCEGPEPEALTIGVEPGIPERSGDSRLLGNR